MPENKNREKRGVKMKETSRGKGARKM